MNVMAVLTLGLLMTGSIGIINGTYDIYGWMGSMGTGITNMGELIIITMMAGGLLEIVRENGGVDFIMERLCRRISSKRGAELTIALMVSLVDICTANNTVAILTVGGISKQVGDRFGVDSRKAASILDTFSCCMQGLIPYGAQILMAAGLASINPVTIIPYLYYPITIGVCAIAAILFIPVFIEYLKTGLVLRFPTLIVSGFSMMASILSLFSGLILQTIIFKDRQSFEFRLQVAQMQYKSLKEKGDY
jgi:Na+/H+ antiporter NhaC